jgi:hypothetical protein
VITFSTKGEPFEGDKERFSAHRNDCLIALDDFHRLVVEVGPDKRVITPRTAITGTTPTCARVMRWCAQKAGRAAGPTCPTSWETGLFMLKTRRPWTRARLSRSSEDTTSPC